MMSIYVHEQMGGAMKENKVSIEKTLENAKNSFEKYLKNTDLVEIVEQKFKETKEFDGKEEIELMALEESIEENLASVNTLSSSFLSIWTEENSDSLNGLSSGHKELLLNYIRDQINIDIQPIREKMEVAQSFIEEFKKLNKFSNLLNNIPPDSPIFQNKEALLSLYTSLLAVNKEIKKETDKNTLSLCVKLVEELTENPYEMEHKFMQYMELLKKLSIDEMKGEVPAQFLLVIGGVLLLGGGIGLSSLGLGLGPRLGGSLSCLFTSLGTISEAKMTSTPSTLTEVEKKFWPGKRENFDDPDSENKKNINMTEMFKR